VRARRGGEGMWEGGARAQEVEVALSSGQREREEVFAPKDKILCLVASSF